MSGVLSFCIFEYYCYVLYVLCENVNVAVFRCSLVCLKMYGSGTDLVWPACALNK